MSHFAWELVHLQVVSMYSGLPVYAKVVSEKYLKSIQMRKALQCKHEQLQGIYVLICCKSGRTQKAAVMQAYPLCCNAVAACECGEQVPYDALDHVTAASHMCLLAIVCWLPGSLKHICRLEEVADSLLNQQVSLFRGVR